MWRLRNIKENIENKVLKLDPVEVKVRQATNDEPWGPTYPQLSELTDISYQYEFYPQLMVSIWERLRHPFATWRNIYKSLLVLDFLVKFGTDRVSISVQANQHVLQGLTHNNYTDDDGKDQTRNIVHRVNEILSLVNNPTQLESERKRAHEYNQRMSTVRGATSSHNKRMPLDEQPNSAVSSALKIYENVKNKISRMVGSETEPYYEDEEFNEPANSKYLDRYSEDDKKYDPFEQTEPAPLTQQISEPQKLPSENLLDFPTATEASANEDFFDPFFQPQPPVASRLPKLSNEEMIDSLLGGIRVQPESNLNATSLGNSAAQSNFLLADIEKIKKENYLSSKPHPSNQEDLFGNFQSANASNYNFNEHAIKSDKDSSLKFDPSNNSSSNNNLLF